MAASNEGKVFNDARFDHLLRCMEVNEEYQEEKREEERSFDRKCAPFCFESLEVMRGFVPPSVFSISEATLQTTTTTTTATGGGGGGCCYSPALAKRIIQKRCLWLVRLSSEDISKLHFADLSVLYGTGTQTHIIISYYCIFLYCIL